MDCLAFQAASGYPLHNLQPWLDDVTKHGFVEAAGWIWYLFKPGTRWDGSQVLFPAGPLTHPDVSVLPAVNPQVAARPEEQAELNIKIATCNVLSLKPPSHVAVAKQSMFVEASSTGPARQESLLQQFHDAGVHIFAWQETRLRKLYNRHDERYWLFRSPATAHGHYGILIGLQRALPIGQKNHQDVFISEHEISIISAAPRFLILRLHNPLLKCIIIAAHAPHTGTEESLISDWWTDLAAAIPPKYQQWDRLLLSDANARVGSEPTEHVGDHQAEPFDPKAEGFLSFLSQQGLWAPATFSRFHKGLGMTWRHARECGFVMILFASHCAGNSYTVRLGLVWILMLDLLKKTTVLPLSISSVEFVLKMRLAALNILLCVSMPLILTFYAALPRPTGILMCIHMLKTSKVRLLMSFGIFEIVPVPKS